MPTKQILTPDNFEWEISDGGREVAITFWLWEHGKKKLMTVRLDHYDVRSFPVMIRSMIAGQRLAADNLEATLENP